MLAVYIGCQSTPAPETAQKTAGPEAAAPTGGGATPTAPAPAQPDAAAATTTYYIGTSQVSAPDGKIPYGPPKVNAAQRVVDPTKGTIIETVLDDGALRTTILRRQGESNRFSATDDAKSFSGVVTFEGPAWHWTGWTYDITISEGAGKVVGTASIDDTSIRTEKYFIGPDGNKTVQIVDVLKVVTKDEYDKAIAEQKKP